jgi:tetratricopeptide (TPR) repeat protein
MGELDIDTRSDIYALGVLLYELLTGTTPFDAEKLRSSAYDEMLKAIRETEPPKPSTRLNTLGNALTDVAKHRHAQPSELCKIIRGDLDWVVMKTLEKERSRRYETANELAMDIERHLGDEPVLAGAPSAGYRLRKFIRRNRRAVSVGLAVMAALMIGLSLAVVGFVRASHAQARAEDQREQAEANFQMARDAVDEIMGVGRRLLGPIEQVRREMLQKARVFYTGLLEENSDDPEVFEENGRIYKKLGEIHRRLGHYKQAEKAYGNAIEIFEKLDDDLPGISYDRHLLAVCYRNLLSLLFRRPVEAEKVHVQALGFLNRLGENEVATRAYWRNMVAYGKDPKEAKVFRLSEEVSCVRAETPKNLLPLAGSLVESFPVVFNVSSFVHDSPKVTHKATWWQVRTADESYSHPALDCICDENLESMMIPQERLLPRTTYYWRASFIDSDGHASEFSSEQSFTTADFSVEVVRFDLSPYFNRDVVANPGDQENDIADGQGGLFVEDGFDGLVSDNPEARGLPHDHVVGVHLLADYNNVNALQTSTLDKGSLRVDIPSGSYSCVRFLVSGGNGDCQVPISFLFADGSTQREIISCNDWYYNTPTGPMGALYSGVTPVVDGMDRLWYGDFSNSNAFAVFEVSSTVPEKLKLSGFVLEMGEATYHDLDYGYDVELTRFNLLAATGVRFLPGRLDEAQEAFQKAQEVEEEVVTEETEDRGQRTEVRRQ